MSVEELAHERASRLQTNPYGRLRPSLRLVFFLGAGDFPQDRGIAASFRAVPAASRRGKAWRNHAYFVARPYPMAGELAGWAP